MPSQPQRSLIAFLANETGKSYTVDASNAVQLQSLPTRIRHLPKGWIDFTLKYTRNNNYRGIFRSFVDEITFVKDSLRILRHLQYTGRGTQETVYFLLYELDRTTGVYELFDRQRVDLSQWVNDDTGVATKLVQGGIAYYLKQHENDVYELDFGNDQVYNDGILLDDTFNYKIFEQDIIYQNETLGTVFINNEGDNVGITKGSQTIDNGAATSEYYQTSKNYSYSSINAISVSLTGSISFIKTSGNIGTITFGFTTSAGQNIVLYSQLANNIPTATQIDIPFNVTISLAANENLFFVAGGVSAGVNIHVLPTDWKAKFQSRNAPYIHAAMRPNEVAQALLDKMTGNRGYKWRSTLATNNSDDYWTSGDALRGLPGGKLKISWAIFWDLYRKQYDAVSGVDEANLNDPVLYIEAPEYSFDNTIEIANIGEVTNFRDSVNTDRLYSKIIVGGKDQQYDERAGKFEPNSENTFTTPIETGQNELDLRFQARIDPYGITFQGAKYFEKPTTDSGSDNDVFIVNTAGVPQYQGVTVVVTDDSKFLFVSAVPTYMLKDAKFQYSGSIVGNDGLYTVLSVIGNVVTVAETTIAESAPNAMIMLYAVPLARPPYNPLTGVPPSIFNLKYLPNPYRTQGTWSGGLQQLQNEYVTFDNSKKNAAVTVGMFTANANIPISNTSSYWRHFDFTFETRIPRNILTALRAVPSGYITFLVNGYPLQGFVDDISIKPAFLPSQSWKLICSSLVNIAQLEYIRNAAFLNIAGGMYSFRNALKMIPAGVSYPAQYHFKQMDTDWHMNRIGRFADQRKYFQKWQTNDTTTVQVVTDQSSVAFTIYDCKGLPVATITPVQKINPFINYPFMLWEATINFGVLIPDNAYSLQMVIGTGGGAKTFLSEPFHVRTDWEDTLLLEYWNSENMPDFVWSTGVHARIRVEGGFPDFQSRFRGSIYEDESLDAVQLGGKTYRRYNMIFGGDGQGLPDWMIDLLSRVFECDNTLIDGVSYTLDEDSNG